MYENKDRVFLKAFNSCADEHKKQKAMVKFS